MSAPCHTFLPAAVRATESLIVPLCVVSFLGPTSLVEDDDDEDEDFDLFEASSNPPNSDEAIGDQLEALQSIPSRELLSLFEENAVMRSVEGRRRHIQPAGLARGSTYLAVCATESSIYNQLCLHM